MTTDSRRAGEDGGGAAIAPAQTTGRSAAPTPIVGLPDILSVQDIMARYRVRDRRTARRIMDEAGCFTIRGSAYVYADDLASLERERRTRAPDARDPASVSPRRRRKAATSEAPAIGLPRHWWQQPADPN